MTAGREPSAVEIVGVEYLNSRPLLAGLEEGIPAPFPYRFATAEPARCAELLASGSAVAALAPVAAIPALSGVETLPGLGIACRGPVTSVLVVSKVRPEAIRVMACHRASRTSVVLARLLLAERWGVRPRTVDAEPPLAAMLKETDAALVIGDPALRLHGRSGLLELDLGAAWVEWTSLPFVFAVWAVRSDAPAGLGELLQSSFEHALGRWEELLPLWAVNHGIATDQVRQYLGSTLTFRLGDEERAGMREFLSRAAAAGLLPGRQS